jgi:hypothetical protein
MQIERTSSMGREGLTKNVRLWGGWGGVKVKCTYIIHAIGKTTGL